MLLSKNQYRGHLRAKRDEYARTHNIGEETLALIQNAISAIPISSTTIVGSYWPQGSEVDGSLLLQHFFKNNYQCALPVMERPDKILLFRQWQPGARLMKGRYNVMVPDESSPLVTPTLLFVPLIGFDRAGNRLGQGVGYYDRTINRIRSSGLVTAIGIAFDCQEVAALPCEAHDERMDYIVTPTKAIEVKR